MSDNTDGDSNGAFQRIPSESALKQANNSELDTSTKKSKPWERSQSAMDLKNNRVRSLSVEYPEEMAGGSVSEQSKVYWDLSQAEDDLNAMARRQGGKLKISLQTIHQKEEMGQGQPSVTVKTRVIRRMGSDSNLQPGTVNTTEYHEITLPNSEPEARAEGQSGQASAKTSRTELKFHFNQGKQNLTVTLEKAVPVLKENIKLLRADSISVQFGALQDMLEMIEQAWATPTIGRDLAYGLCDVLRSDGGLDILIENCATQNYDIKLESARVLEQSMTVGNRDAVAQKGLEIIINMAKSSHEDESITKAVTGILESLFKHSQETCTRAVHCGGLDSILFSCRTMDTLILRHCAEALANLAMFGGEENQQEMIMHKAAEWLFPLAFSDDDAIRYYAFLAIATLSANKELEAAVVKSGTLELVKPFILTHEPSEFAKSDKAHIHGQSKEWLQHLLPLLESKREEAQSLAAFHFAMEAGIKEKQGKIEVFSEIGAIDALKKVACGTNKLASKFASQALGIIGEQAPYKLSAQVPLWASLDVTRWLQQVGFSDFAAIFEECQVDGDILLSITEDILASDLNMTNGIMRYRFFRELSRLKEMADYDCCDPSHLDDWLREISKEYSTYSYRMLKSGVDRRILRLLTEDHLHHDCCIQNGVHRLRILEAAKRMPSSTSMGFDMTDDPLGKPVDVFISYRRSNGSQLASLLKVHLQLKGFTVFLDIEKLRAGKFDDNLLYNVRSARNFILVLTPNSLDRCLGDIEHKDWVHREVAAAIEGGCNIIPVMDNFEWPAPEDLPEDMRPVCYFNGIRWIHDYQDACVSKLEQFLHGERITSSAPVLCKANSLGSTSGSIHGASMRSGSLDLG